MNKIISQLKKSKNIFVASHINPDGDAIGSLIAMGLGLDWLKKSVTFYNESSIPAVYRFLPEINRIVQKLDGKSEYDTAIILDCSDIKRIGDDAFSIMENIQLVINIDHHITNTQFGHYKLINTSACATAELVYNIIQSLDVPINMAIATSIYTAILTDTGSFRFSNTNISAFKICEEMIKVGVEPYYIAKNVYGKYSAGRLKLLNLALNSIEISYNGKLSIMTLTQNMFKRTGAYDDDIDGFINYARSIEHVKVAALIHEQSNGKKKSGCGKFHVSLRSDGTVDVAKIATSFGGGGHYTASGFSIEANLADLKVNIFKLAEDL
ncbi:MAG: bifunctional oligoribonuclease/PAP phosphatase NrnA [Desulfobacterales bacterium]|nr:bifunctional oligoribonuclease/PAP phosphatase NrnA [Desulfobacterales bacterium]MBF0395828.1 bifunctional oligoribonuclease/PAP phosphatase NrnA [Desulfobacterales bacterium]